jgi:AcrR family transcriptional regulator
MNQREIAKKATQARIRAAAKAQFDAVGYEAATIREIAKAAGMSTGAIFANWTGKGPLWVEIMGCPPPADGALYRCADALATSLLEAAGQFRFYEAQHKAKGTVEADAKAVVNAELARRYEALVVAARSPLPFEREAV